MKRELIDLYEDYIMDPIQKFLYGYLPPIIWPVCWVISFVLVLGFWLSALLGCNLFIPRKFR